MIRDKSPIISVFILIPLLFVSSACFSNESNNRWANAQRESTQGTPTTSPAQTQQPTQNNPVRSSKPFPGGSFNRFFPAAGEGFTRVASQEKEGFAEYKLKKDGKDMAMLAISDTITNPEAAQKFQASTKQIGGYPAVEQGATATAVLVDNRFQVKVLSRNPAFTRNEREAWLQKFDLRGLAGL